MAITVKAKVERWVTATIDTEDLDEAYARIEEEIEGESQDLIWGESEVTIVECIGCIEDSSLDNDTFYEEWRERQCAIA